MIFENIQKLCKEKGITISELERELNFGNGVIGRWRESAPRIDNAKKVANYFGVTIEQLLEE